MKAWAPERREQLRGVPHPEPHVSRAAAEQRDHPACTLRARAHRVLSGTAVSGGNPSHRCRQRWCGSGRGHTGRRGCGSAVVRCCAGASGVLTPKITAKPTPPPPRVPCPQILGPTTTTTTTLPHALGSAYTCTDLHGAYTCTPTAAQSRAHSTPHSPIPTSHAPTWSGAARSSPMDPWARCRCDPRVRAHQTPPNPSPAPSATRPAPARRCGTLQPDSGAQGSKWSAVRLGRLRGMTHPGSWRWGGS